MKRKSFINAIIFSLLIGIFSGEKLAVACVGGCPEGTCNLASVTFDIPRSTITADTLVILLKSGNASLIEYRRAAQKAEMKIPGAMVICDDVDVASITQRLPARDRLLIVYPGLESVNVASLTAGLRELGYQSIVEFQAGIQGWLTYGYKTEETSQP
ncbi:MAG: hypothetical protein A2W80_02205 [Candidatus Riflebacteria bacterium GWC2_50_8]|nr:MAG: hypothetical protein A2W80_02205 [Candidatus Riflebacteria bacterium GWC2_50_8]